MPEDYEKDSVELRLARYERMLRMSNTAGGGLIALVTVYAAVKFGESSNTKYAVLAALTLTAILLSGVALSYTRGKFEWHRDLLTRTIAIKSLPKETTLETAKGHESEIELSWPKQTYAIWALTLCGLLISSTLLLIYVWLLALHAEPEKGHERALLPVQATVRTVRVVRNPIATVERATREVRILLLPREIVSIRVRFNAQRRQRIHVIERSGAAPPSLALNSASVVTKANRTNAAQSWTIYAESAVTSVWRRSRVVALEENEDYIKVGFDDDARDQDFDDVVVEATISPDPSFQ